MSEQEAFKQYLSKTEFKSFQNLRSMIKHRLKCTSLKKQLIVIDIILHDTNWYSEAINLEKITKKVFNFNLKKLGKKYTNLIEDLLIQKW